MRRDNQAQYEQVIADATQGMLQNQMNKFRADQALDLREDMFSALFVANGRPFEDTMAKSRRKAMTTVAYNKHQGQQSRQTDSRQRRRRQRQQGSQHTGDVQQALQT